MSERAIVVPEQYFFCDLPFAEQLTLWGCRIWVRGYELQTSIDERLFDAFAKVRTPQAAGLLDKIMRTIVIGHTRVVEINCPSYRLVGDDERVLLDVIARYQAGHRDKPWFPLCRFLQPYAAQCAGRLMNELAGMLTEVGLDFTHPSQPAEKLHRPLHTTTSGAVSTRLH